MDSGDVRYWLNVHSDCRLKDKAPDGAMAIEVDEESFDWCLDHASLIRGCDEIAQAHEQEVALMAEALRFILVRVKPLGELMKGGQWVKDWSGKAEAALQSAPKVLWAGDAGWDTETHENNEPVLWLALGDPIHLGRTTGPITEEDGTLAKVIVLEGPTALQEQSKAQEPDGQCSVNEGSEPKSEQGYKRAKGVIPWKEGDELPEDTIARIRGRESEQEEPCGTQ